MITKAEIVHYLESLGFKHSLSGFFYSVCAIEYVYNDRGLLNGRVTKDLYPFIAAKYSTTCVRVERAIRHSVRRSQFLINGKIPCNTEFIAKAVDDLKYGRIKNGI